MGLVEKLTQIIFTGDNTLQCPPNHAKLAIQLFSGMVRYYNFEKQAHEFLCAQQERVEAWKAPGLPAANVMYANLGTCSSQVS